MQPQVNSTPDLPIRERVLRYAEMEPCKTAFIDARTPGSDKKENFCLIGAGVAENPDQVVHITIPHGFDIGGARQPKGCKNSHHSHNTEEVFVVHKGEWLFTWGENGTDGQQVLRAGDTISLPMHLFRGFENVGSDDGMLFSVLGQNADGTAGHVIWAPYVFSAAKEHGLILLEDGRLIDTAAGQTIPEDGEEAKPSSTEELATFKRLSVEEMGQCVMTSAELQSGHCGGLSSLPGVTEIAVIGQDNPAEGIGAGKMAWPHRFCVRRLLLEAQADIPFHTRAEEEVLIVQSGELQVSTPESDFTLGKGDLFTCPVGMQRRYWNSAQQPADVIVVRRGDYPEAARFV